MEQEIRKSKLNVTGHIAGVKSSANNPYGHKGSVASKIEMTKRMTKNDLCELTACEQNDLWFSETVKTIKGEETTAGLRDWKQALAGIFENDLKRGEDGRTTKERIDAIDLEIRDRENESKLLKSTNEKGCKEGWARPMTNEELAENKPNYWNTNPMPMTGKNGAEKEV